MHQKVKKKKHNQRNHILEIRSYYIVVIVTWHLIDVYLWKNGRHAWVRKVAQLVSQELNLDRSLAQEP